MTFPQFRVYCLYVLEAVDLPEGYVYDESDRYGPHAFTFGWRRETAPEGWNRLRWEGPAATGRPVYDRDCDAPGRPGDVYRDRALAYFEHDYGRRFSDEVALEMLAAPDP